MDIDQRIELENQRHHNKIKELKDLLQVYQKNNDNFYAKQIQDLKEQLDEEIALHSKNMEELNYEKNQLGMNTIPSNINKDYISSAINEIKAQVPDVTEVMLKGIYYDSFSNLAYVSVLSRDGVIKQVTINKKDYELLCEYFNHYPENINISKYENEKKPKEEKEEEKEKVETLKDDKLSKEEIINKLLEAMYPEGIDNASVNDIKNNLETKSIEELQQSLVEFNTLNQQNLNVVKPYEPEIINDAEKKKKDDLINELINAMYPDELDNASVIDIKNNLEKKSIEELQQDLDKIYASQANTSTMTM